MLNKLFGKSKNFEAEAALDPKADAESILQSVDHNVVKCAWDEYMRIKKLDTHYDDSYEDVQNTYHHAIPAWAGLQKLAASGGDFGGFSGKEDVALLAALKDGFIYYDDMVHVLIDHHNDKEAGQHIFEAHPELHQYMPEKYDDNEHVLEVILEIVRDYQWQLGHFAEKYGDKIELKLAALEGRAPDEDFLDHYRDVPEEAEPQQS